jgi:drug/metabolite transporter (DMT)-like permease
MLVLATAFWALSFPTMKAVTLAQQDLLPGASTWFCSALCMVYRFGIGAGVLLLVCGRSLRALTRLELWEGFGLGVFASTGLVLQMDGLARIDASTSAFLTQCYCLFIPLWVAVGQRRGPAPVVWISCALVVLGVAILSKLDWRTLRLGRGEFETLLASVVFTGQILWLQRPVFARNRVRHFTLAMFATIALACLPVAGLTAQRPADLWRGYATPAMAVFAAVLVVFCTLAAFLLMNAWQPRVGATQAGLIYCAEPVFASLVSLVLPGWWSRLAGIAYPNETLGPSLLIGGGLITVANVLVQIQPPEPAHRPDQSRLQPAREPTDNSQTPPAGCPATRTAR